MIKIQYPPHRPNIKMLDGKEFIFDEIRRQWVVLTPEEWVRQNFLGYLVREKLYPASLLAVEKEIEVSGLRKRFDIVVYGRDALPWMIVECKEMNVALKGPVLDQALRYNISLGVKYIAITNGSYCYAFLANAGKLEEINELPAFEIS
jgi:hypothetical protein